MKVINLSDGNTIMNKYLEETRDVNYQNNRLLFRNNIQRIGQVMAYEISKALEYKPQLVTTPLGTLHINLPEDNLVIATVLRAGCRSIKDFSMCSTMPTMLSSAHTACTPIVSIHRWVCIPNIWHRQAWRARHCSS